VRGTWAADQRARASTLALSVAPKRLRLGPRRRVVDHDR
jgi:hypothetical protein